MTISIWPQLLLEDGPPIAGIEVGDAIAIPPDRPINAYESANLLLIAPMPYLELRPEAKLAGWRVDSASGRVERKEVDTAWAPAASPTLVLRGRRFRFVVDGPALATVKEFPGKVRVAHARSILSFRADDQREQEAISIWLQVSRRMRNDVLVEERPGSGLRTLVRRRAIGIPVEVLFEVAERHPFEREVAAAIAGGLRDGEPNAAVSFDGDVNSPSDTADGGLSRADTFARLAYGRRIAPSELIAMNRELEGTPRATRERLRDLIRGLFPAEHARETELVEQCRVLAG